VGRWRQRRERACTDRRIKTTTNSKEDTDDDVIKACSTKDMHRRLERTRQLRFETPGVRFCTPPNLRPQGTLLWGWISVFMAALYTSFRGVGFLLKYWRQGVGGATPTAPFACFINYSAQYRQAAASEVIWNEVLRAPCGAHVGRKLLISRILFLFELKLMRDPLVVEDAHDEERRAPPIVALQRPPFAN